MYHFDWIKRHAERTPDHLALVEIETGREFTYAQFNERANRFASYMVNDLGLKRGDRVSILAGNSTDYLEILFACGKAGIILNTLNWRLAVPELEFILNDCTPRYLIYEPTFTESAKTVLATVNSLKGAVVLGETGAENEITYEAALAAGDPAGVLMPDLTYDDTWAIIYTSGTTGKPKGAQVTYGNFFYNAVGMGRAIDLTSQDININVLPTFHIGGLGLYAGPTLHSGGTVLIMKAFSPDLFLKAIADYKVTVGLLVPSIYLVLDQYEGFDKADLSTMRHWASGGSPLPSALVHTYAERNILIQQGFGMTETGPTVFLVDIDHAVEKAGSVGKPVLHTDVRIEDPETGEILGPNQHGELCVKGGNVTRGYWNRPDATEAAIRAGWLHTGDVAMYDDDGFYYIVDRVKDMYISGGENVYPAEVENILYEHPAIAEVAVIGVPHPTWQEVGKAIVVLKQGQSITEEDVIAFCQGKMAKYKIPKSAAFIDALPRTAAGKVLKRELRQQYAEG